jgi:phosphoglycerate dehydrogenase-like enzyme
MTPPTPIVVDGPERTLEKLRSLLPDEHLVRPEDVDLSNGAVALVTHTRKDMREQLASLVGPATEWLHVLSTGVDSVPLDVVPEGVTVTCSRGASAVPISEYCVAMMLAHAKQLPGIWLDEPPERWNVARLGSLDGATIGLVGVGSIATWVARRLAGFDVRLLGYRRRPLPAPDPRIEIATSLPEVLAAADHLVVAAASTPETYHLIDAAALAQVKPGVHIVNVARGTLIDQDALVRAIDDGRVARASLDVVDPEPLPAGHVLYRHPQVFVSAHVSWNAPGSMMKNYEGFTENVARYRAGEPLGGVVDRAAGY